MKIIISLLVVVVLLFGTTLGFAITWQNTEENLEAANQAILDEYNRSQWLSGEIDRLRQELKVKEESLNYANQKLAKAWGALDQMQAELDQGTIIGRVFVDQYHWGSLDDVDRPAKGFKVRLYQITKKTPAGTESALVAEVSVNSKGEYRFVVQPGEYYAQPVLVIDGYPQWDYAKWLKSPGNMIVEKGQITIGPTFLLSIGLG